MKKRTHVTIVNAAKTHGGVERQISYICDGLSGDDAVQISIVYLSLGTDDSLPTRSERVYYAFWPLLFRKGLLKLFTIPIACSSVLWRLLFTKPDVVHTFGPMENLLGAIVATCVGARHVASVRTNNPWAYRFIRVWGRTAARVMTNADSIRNELRARYRVPVRKVSVVRNGIDLDLFKFKPWATDARQRTSFVIAELARISPVKNQAMLLAAVDAFRTRLLENTDKPRFRLEFIGAAENRTYQQTVARMAELVPPRLNVEFSPYATDVAGVYHGIDLLVLPSRSEGLPNVLIEAMACGVPWIASDVADALFLASNGQDERGSVFALSGGAKALEDALVDFWSMDYQELQDRLVRARSFVEQNFDLSVAIASVRAFYKSVVS